MPIVIDILSHQPKKNGAHGIGGINSTGQVPEMSNHFALVDPDTPSSATYYNTQKDGSKWQIIFSDEFNTDNRSFYPVSRCWALIGRMAVDAHYL